ncbi:MAG: clan AA aspartic protease, partial [Verrucomicrobiales bacterium]|nr:clan AA aspartic protease [Verrucomicrobiales bacterium]
MGSEAGRIQTEPERTLVRAREAYWDGRTDDALRLWRDLLATPSRTRVPADALRWWMIVACEDAERWGEALRLAAEFGFDRSHPARFGLARALEQEPARELEFEGGGTPHAFALEAGHWVVVRARVNGVEARLLVDTGFSLTLIASDFADRAEVRRLGASVTISDAHGRSRPADVGLLESLSVAGAAARRWPVVVGDLGAIESWTGPLDGVVGWDLLRRATVTWNFPDRTLTLEPPGMLSGLAPVLSGRRAPMLECTSSDGHPLTLFLDTGYASRPATVVLHANAGVLDSKVDRKRFSRSLKPSFGAGMHSWRMRWPRRSKNWVLGFDGHEFVMPLALRRREVSVFEGMQACDGMLGVAPFLG